VSFQAEQVGQRQAADETHENSHENSMDCGGGFF